MVRLNLFAILKDDTLIMPRKKKWGSYLLFICKELVHH